ncbi:MAG: ribonuclease D [Alphaproteobacteria bacterium]
MTLITETGELARLCDRRKRQPFVAVDTEFMRERTFWPKLCLIQLAGDNEAAAIDPLADGLDLGPLLRLLVEPGVVKVFHAARQDIEIFHRLSDRVPAPLFDTQIAAMVCGFGESVAYDTLVSRLTGVKLDKTLRFTDWSRRPLTESQVAYALADVVHLPAIYRKLARRLDETGRRAWLAEEMAGLTDPRVYETRPQDAWLRLKTRSDKPRFLAVLRELAAWREREAQARDVPRNRVLRDEALVTIAAHAPTTAAELARTRLLRRGLAEGATGRQILRAVVRGQAVPEAECPRFSKPPRPKVAPGAVADLLKVLLKLKCDEHGVASKLVASAADLDRLAVEAEPDIPALEGWRREIFGNDALTLKAGRLALAADGKKIRLVPLGSDEGRDHPAASTATVTPRRPTARHGSSKRR